VIIPVIDTYPNFIEDAKRWAWPLKRQYSWYALCC
jgi:hypothetical protein